jgi:transcriptional regulator with XRE-family HTH domain
VRSLVGKATDLVSGQHRQIAANIGVTPHAIACWRTGKRRPSPENLARLGNELLRRARELQFAGYELLKASENLRHPVPGGSMPVSADQQTLFR